MNLKKIVFIFFILSLPFTGVFRLTEKLSLPIIIASVYLFLSLEIIHALRRRLALIITIFFLIFLVTIYHYNIRVLVYSLSICFSFFIFINTGVKATENRRLFYRWLNISIWIAASYVILEWVDLNIVDSGIFRFQRNDGIVNYNATYLGGYIRPRGLAEESGHMSLFFEFAAPLILLENSYQRSQFDVYRDLLLVIALFLLFSPFSILLALLTLFLSLRKLKKPGKIILVLGSLSVLANMLPLLSQAYEAIMLKATYSPDVGSSMDRLNRINFFFREYSFEILGLGPLNFRSISPFETTLNLFLDILLFYGPILFCIVVVYLLSASIYLLRKRNYGILLSFLFVMFHYNFITNFWYPYLGFLIGFMLNRNYDNRIPDK